MKFKFDTRNYFSKIACEPIPKLKFFFWISYFECQSSFWSKEQFWNFTYL